MRITLNIQYGINTGQVLNSAELQQMYFYGIQIQDRSGQSLSKDTWNFFIQSAQETIEDYLEVKLQKQIIEEQMDFYQDEYRNFGYIQVTYPCVKAFRTTGMLGTVKQIDYPKGWLTARKTSDKKTYWRRIFVVPSQSTEPVMTGGSSILYSGVLPFTSMYGFYTIPNYWMCSYCTGFETIPKDILDVIGKMAAIGLFNIAGDIALGQAALANYSLSIDGLSQSVGTTNSATNAAFGARIINYQKEIKDSLAKLKRFYTGIVATSM